MDSIKNRTYEHKRAQRACPTLLESKVSDRNKESNEDQGILAYK